jgi:signal peptidase I
MNWKFWKKKTGEETGKPKSKLREWGDAILFAVVAATLIRWLIMEAYTIPTSSMENSLLVGDFLFVSKFHYGTRTTSTPLQVPLTHQKIWFTNIPSYSEAIKLPQYRLPGISEVKREDVVVFNVPTKTQNSGVDYPVDLKTNYIKRCVGIPGDTLVIKDNQVIVNGQPLKNPEQMQYEYHVYAAQNINPRNFERINLDEDDYSLSGQTTSGEWLYRIVLTEEKLKALKAYSFIKRIEIIKANDAGSTIPNSSDYQIELPDPGTKPHFQNWTRDNFGPLWVPKEGATLAINDSTLALYGFTIVKYDYNDDAKIENGKLIIGGKEVTKYTFKQDYYFMMGDNRHRSLDSRYFGFVPADHIVGKAFFIWLSIDKNQKFFNKIRWSRFFKGIE